MLPRAETYHLRGLHPRAAWGRAAAEWPEFKSGRALVELFLVWRHLLAIWNGAFGDFARFDAPSGHNCVVVEQAPSSHMLRTLPSLVSDARAMRHTTGNTYITHVLKLHEKLHATGPTRIRRAARRDAGAKRQPASGLSLIHI